MTNSTGHLHLRFALLVAIGFAALGPYATKSWATVILPDVPAGTRYEILFVTLDTMAATSTDISTYNGFASTEANLSPTLESVGVQWHAVGTTPTSAAFLNAPDNNVPVYNTQGILIASSAAGIYGGSLLNPVQFNQFGNSEPANAVWTGTQPDGGNALGYAQLGSSWGLGGGGGPIIGQSTSTSANWLDAGYSFPLTTTYPIYALSSPVPEPATLALLVSAFLVICGMRLVRRRAHN